jgi:hypothetical protein
MVQAKRTSAAFRFSSTRMATDAAKRLKTALREIVGKDFSLGWCKTAVVQMTQLGDWSELRRSKPSEGKETLLDRDLNNAALISRRRKQATYLSGKAGISLPDAYKTVNEAEIFNNANANIAFVYEGRQRSNEAILRYRLPRTWSDEDGLIDSDDLDDNPDALPYLDILEIGGVGRGRGAAIRVGSNDTFFGSTMDFHDHSDVKFARVTVLRQAVCSCDNRSKPILSPDEATAVEYELTVFAGDHQGEPLNKEAIGATAKYLAQIVFRDLLWIFTRPHPSLLGKSRYHLNSIHHPPARVYWASPRGRILRTPFSARARRSKRVRAPSTISGVDYHRSLSWRSIMASIPSTISWTPRIHRETAMKTHRATLNGRLKSTR